ncbi:MAG TPA: IDEAL domain-containing protein [Cerasibacillus sp.]|uniref:IDEAL domain-containing protein n=1 Tax=Cerasibacillus sp. TaxID=2498711 RepID=UPI002F42087A
MNKEKTIYRFKRYQGNRVQAKREISFEMMLSARLLLDEICFQRNKEQLMTAIDTAIESGDQEMFQTLSEFYKQYVWE